MTAAEDRIVITGAGVICALGAGVEAFERALFDGVSGLGEATFGGERVLAGAVRDFNPQPWLGNKGIRVLDRSARLLCVSAHLAVGHARYPAIGPEGTPDLGLVCGTLFGGLHSIVSFDWSGLTDGPAYVNPMEFANTVINSPAGQAAIKFGLRGINSTVCAGLASGLYAVQYAADALRLGRARALLAGGVEELCEESIVGFGRAGFLAAGGAPRIFAGRETGTILGEGAAMFILETAASAQARGAVPWAEIAGFGCAHDSPRAVRDGASSAGAIDAMQDAMISAGVGPERIGCVIASGNGSRAGDERESRALRAVFQGRLDRLRVSAPKAALGETMGASGAIAALAGALAARNRIAPPTVGFEGGPEALPLSSKPQPFEQECVLVNAFSCDGNHASLIVKRWSE